MASKLHLGIETTMGKMTAPFDGPVVSHLHDPGAGGTFRAVEDGALPLNKNEHVLNEIFRFCGISQDTNGNAADDSLVSLKEKA
jgi:hypothetical protein